MTQENIQNNIRAICKPQNTIKQHCGQLGYNYNTGTTQRTQYHHFNDDISLLDL